jgi:hypothetical protein
MNELWPWCKQIGHTTIGTALNTAVPITVAIEQSSIATDHLPAIFQTIIKHNKAKGEVGGQLKIFVARQKNSREETSLPLF